MFAVEVRDSIMVAHSLPDPFFGPAANKHGATFIVDVAFFRPTLTRLNVVVDIGRAQTAQARANVRTLHVGWVVVWARLSYYLVVPAGPPGRSPLARMMADEGPVWDRSVGKLATPGM